MFTIKQIKAVHATVKSGADFPRYVQELKALGLVAYDHHVSDGHLDYHGQDQVGLSSEATYSPLSIAEVGSADELRAFLGLHQQGQTDYLTFCQQAAQAGVAKWTVDMLTMRCTYYDQEGGELIIETIPPR